MFEKTPLRAFISTCVGADSQCYNIRLYCGIWCIISDFVQLLGKGI